MITPQDYTILRVLAIPVCSHIGVPGLTLDLDHLECREGVEYLPEIFSIQGFKPAYGPQGEEMVEYLPEIFSIQGPD